jgi:hypothetical protein
MKALFLRLGVGLLALASLSLACISGDDGGGAVGGSCQTTNDCVMPFVCVPVTANFTCATGSNPPLTCQRGCGDPADCAILGSNFTCSVALEKCSAGYGQLCVPE